MSEWKVSQRRACRVLQLDPTSYRYNPLRPAQATLESRIREICQTRVRYGYRRVHVLLRREGWMINHRKSRRIYCELGMQLPSKTQKRRVKAKLRDDRKEATRAHETWAMDFVHDQLATGSKLRILTVVDLFSRFSPVIDSRFSYRGEDVVATLERVCADVGYPDSIRADQGSKFISRDLDLWAYQNNVTLDFSRPGKPTDNAFIEVQGPAARGVFEHALVPDARGRRRFYYRRLKKSSPVFRQTTERGLLRTLKSSVDQDAEIASSHWISICPRSDSPTTRVAQARSQHKSAARW